jgi:hypothetical protein
MAVDDVRRRSVGRRRGIVLVFGAVLVVMGVLSLGATPASAHSPHPECENVPNPTNDQGRPAISADEFVRLLDACEKRQRAGGSASRPRRW